jgi:hypothetical protein
MDLRCISKKHGVLLIDEHVVEIKCNSRFCGAAQGVVVLHRFDLQTGECIGTRRFQYPKGNKK